MNADAKPGKVQEFLAPTALLPTGWHRNVRLVVNDGTLTVIESPDDLGTMPASIVELPGPVIPGFPNVHSHAFQRGMAGLAEWRASARDSFWSWRDTMYKFVLVLEPAEIRSIAEFLYAELLTHGYTSVGEFHYVHRDPSGAAYADVAELACLMLHAAETTGIGSTILPTLYSYGGCGGQPLTNEQRRFATTPEEIDSIVRTLKGTLSTLDGAHRVGVAAHSVRAVDPKAFLNLLEQLRQDDPNMPIHMHVAEQQREVDECLKWCGQRPVDWVTDHFPLDEHWCLIHATHVMASELEAIISSQATVGMCPTTEANLGDGVFPAKRFVENAGNLAIGSDSHVSVAPYQELCELEYLQRLVYQGRNMIATADRSTGRVLCEQAWSSGARALGRPVGKLAEGHRADFLVLNQNHPQLVGRSGDQLLDALVICGCPQMIRTTYVGGAQIVAEGKHRDHDRLAESFRDTMLAVLPKLDS